MNIMFGRCVGIEWCGALRILCVSILSIGPTSLFAYEFSSRMDAAQWQLDPSPLECRLWQHVPQYGEVVFSAQSGRELTFYLESDRPSLKKGKAAIKVTAPSWRQGIRDKTIAVVPLKKGSRPVELNEKWANWFLDELYGGMNPSIVLGAWHNHENAQVDLSSVNFQEAYSAYLSCVTALFPANYDQLKTTMLRYTTNGWRVQGKLKDKLDLLIQYINLDPEIEHVYIDGHTDFVGRRGHNWELSRLRSNAVSKYFEHNGVDPEMITMRYHGESRPMTRSRNRAGKAKNRRVYIQLYKPKVWNIRAKKENQPEAR